MQYILDEYEYNKLQRASSEQNDLLQEEVLDLQEELKKAEKEISHLKEQLRKYKENYGPLTEKVDWEKTMKSYASGKFNF